MAQFFFGLSIINQPGTLVQLIKSCTDARARFLTIFLHTVETLSQSLCQVSNGNADNRRWCSSRTSSPRLECRKAPASSHWNPEHADFLYYTNSSTLLFSFDPLSSTSLITLSFSLLQFSAIYLLSSQYCSSLITLTAQFHSFLTVSNARAFSGFSALFFSFASQSVKVRYRYRWATGLLWSS